MINPYKLLNDFSLDEATQTLTGLVAPKTAEEKNTAGLVRRLLQRAIDSRELPATVTEVQLFSEERIGVRRISINDDRDHRPIVKHPYTVTTILIRRADLLAWCEQKQMRPPLLFPDPPPADDLSSYHTPALDALRAAIRQFWLNPDHHCPPKNTDIVEWLMRQFGITKTMAEAIDRVIRPENRRQGGNTKRNR